MEFRYADIAWVRSKAIEEFNNLPTRCRLAGMTSDLKDDDKRFIAIILASISYMSREGALKEGAFALLPRPFTASQEVVEGEVVSYNVK